MAGSNPGYGRLFNDTHGTERTKRTVKIRADHLLVIYRRQSYRISKSLYPEKPLCLEVRTWNVRAVTCYEKAGFRIDDEPFSRTTLIGEGTFYRMVRK